MVQHRRADITGLRDYEECTPGRRIPTQEVNCRRQLIAARDPHPCAERAVEPMTVVRERDRPAVVERNRLHLVRSTHGPEPLSDYVSEIRLPHRGSDEASGGIGDLKGKR